MAAPPYMTVWIADWTADTQHLSCEQDGAYWRLVRAMWRAHGYLPNNPRKLSQIAGVSLKKWNTIGDDVLDFFEVEGDHLIHKRVHETLRSVSLTSSKRVDAGAKGGRAKALKDKERALANATILPEQTPSISDVRYNNSTTREREDDWPDGKPLDHARLICEAAATVHLDLARSPGLVQSLGRLDRWRKEGASWEHDVLPVITGRMAGRRSAITTWSYFDAAIGESIAANAAALTIPEHTNVDRPDHRRAENPHDARRRAHLELLAEHRDAERQDAARIAEGG